MAGSLTMKMPSLNDKKIIADGWFGKALAYNIFEEFKDMFDALQQFLSFADFNQEQRRILDVYRLTATYGGHEPYYFGTEPDQPPATDEPPFYLQYLKLHPVLCLSE